MIIIISIATDAARLHEDTYVLVDYAISIEHLERVFSDRLLKIPVHNSTQQRYCCRVFSNPCPLGDDRQKSCSPKLRDLRQGHGSPGPMPSHHRGG